MISTADEDEKIKFTNTYNNHSGDKQVPQVTRWFLTEDGLYEVLMQSRKPIVKSFKKQVNQILKEIRRHGVYATPETIDKMIANPDMTIKLFTELKNEMDKSIRLISRFKLILLIS